MIVPNDEFTIISFDIQIESARIKKSEPVLIKTFIVETGSNPVEKTLTVDETITTQSAFQESSATTVKHSGKLEVGLSLGIIKSGGSYTFDTSNTQAVAYKSKSSVIRKVSDQTTVIIPPHTKGVIDYQSIKHTMDANYVILFKGVKSEKLIEMRGTWSGIDYTTDHFIINEYDRKTNRLNNTRVIESTSR